VVATRFVGRPVLFLLFAACGWGQVVTTVVGTDWLFPTGSLPALSAPLGSPSAVSVDSAGNLYVADSLNNIIVKVSSAGVLTTVAGNGKDGFSGDGGPATSASLSPRGMALDAAGNLYIADTENNRIRKVTGGVITTVAGTGASGFSGDGPAASATLSSPAGIAVDAAGNLFIADSFNRRIRKLTPGGAISTVAGTGSPGVSGDGGLATNATLESPTGVAVDAAGDLFIADIGLIRKVTPDGKINTLVQANNAAIATDAAGNLYLSVNGSNVVRRVTPSGVVTTVAGTGTQGFSGDGGPAINAMLSADGLAVDAAGNLYVADADNHRVRKVTSNGTISTVAGNNLYRFSGEGGLAVNATLNFPNGLTLDAAGNLYIADTQNDCIRKVSAGSISSFGGGSLTFFGNQPIANPGLNQPAAVVLDPSGNLYISDSLNNHVRKVTPNGTITTAAGDGTPRYFGDGGPATSASLYGPWGLGMDGKGNLFIADSLNHCIRKVTPDGAISTVVGNGSPGFSGDGTPAVNAELNQPTGLAVDSLGNLYIADLNNYRVRKVTTDGIITTVAGNGNQLFSGDGGSATSTAIGQPQAVALDSTGNLYIADRYNNLIFQVTPAGAISAVAGNGMQGFSGDGGPATSASFNSPSGLAAGSGGILYIADAKNNRIRKLTITAAPPVVVTPTSLSFTAISGGLAPAAQSLSLFVTGLAFSATSSASWLSVTPSLGAGPASLQVTVDPSNLAAGTYLGTVTISVPNGAPSATNIAVAFLVEPGSPQLSIGSRTLSFNAVAGGAAQTLQLEISNAGSGALPFTAAVSTTNGSAWLSVSPTSGTATPSNPASLTVTANPGTLAPGTYAGTISITGAGVTANVAVTLSVSSNSAVILISQSGISFTAVAQGGATPPQTFTIFNTGLGSISWTATVATLSGGNWLQISPSSGTVSQPNVDASAVSVSVNPAGLTPGDYYGQIRVSAPAINSPQLITVILTVLPAGSALEPEVQPTGLIFTGTAGSTPGSQDVLVVNPSAQPTSYVSGFIGTGFTYLPTTATVLPNQPTTLRVFPDFSTLQPGVYRGVITLQFSDGSARTVNVLLAVAPSATCSPTNLQIQWQSPAQFFTAVLGQPTNVQVQVVDNCGNLIGPGNPGGAVVTASFSNHDSNLNLTHIGNGVWTGTWKPVSGGAAPAVTISVVAFSSTASAFVSGAANLSGTLFASATPIVTAGGVLNASTLVSGGPIAPGSLITILGSNLADAAGTAPGAPLPDTLNGAQVLLGDQPMPIFFTSPNQLNVQVPYSIPVNTLYQLIVQRDGLFSLPEQLVVAQATPGVFTLNEQGTGQGVIYKSDGVTLAQPGSPAVAGENLFIYCTGLGAVTPPVPEGVPPPASPPAATVNAVTVTIAGQNVPVSFSGLTPGEPGLYQINAIVPKGVSGDAVPLMVTVAGQTSPPVTLAVQ
jgi:uncharacterized protein (TIGR03437 family)